MKRLWWSVGGGIVLAVAGALTPAVAQSPIAPASTGPNVRALGAAPAPVQRADDVSRAPSGPTRERAAVGVRATVVTRNAAAEAEPLFQRRTHSRNGTALMIVGGAALLVGAIIGGDAGTIIMIGGAGIGLYGLYLFVQ